MATKVELEKENELLRELLDGRVTISHSTFNGGPQAEVCKAVTHIALALETAAEALVGPKAPLLNIVDSHDDD